WNLGADHMHVRLALAVNPAAQALRPQFVVGHLSSSPQGSLRPEQFDILADDPIVFLLHELLFSQHISNRHRPPSLSRLPYMDTPKLSLLIFPGLRRPPHDLFQTRGFRPPRPSEVLIDVVAVAHLRPRITHQLPPDQPRVSAVHWIAKHALDGMCAQQLEEARLLDRR